MRKQSTGRGEIPGLTALKVNEVDNQAKGLGALNKYRAKYRAKKVLVACEFSGAVRDAFTAEGHEAWSCDILPSETPGNHYQGDVRELLRERWDILIGHPPCTYLCNSGVRWLATEKGRWDLMKSAAQFFLDLWSAPLIGAIVLENPIPHRHAGLPAWSQLIQPWQFGHGETKATCLWLRGLPPLIPTAIVPGREHRIHRMPPGPMRSYERSRTFSGIARAMAVQWGGLWF